jgi:hypothetical protein
MLGHENVARNNESVSLPNPLERLLKHTVAHAHGQKGLTLVTTECEEMKLSGRVISNEAPGHIEISLRGVGGFPPMSR